jgi:hypothetical protein
MYLIFEVAYLLLNVTVKITISLIVYVTVQINITLIDIKLF